MTILHPVLFLLAFIPSVALANIKMAITVDDLPVHGQLPPGETRVEIAKKMLAILKSNKIPEVYGFINAARAGSDPDLISVLKLWRSAGYPLGNHTFSHPSLDKTTVEEFERNIDQNESILKGLATDSDWHYFRYPFLHEGNTLDKRNAIRKYLQEKGYKTAEVTVDFEDWSWNDPYARCARKRDTQMVEWLKATYLDNAVRKLDRAETITRALYGRPVSHVLLLHVGAFDAEMIEKLIKAYRDKGVEFIPLTQALTDPIYSEDPGVSIDAGAELIYLKMKSKKLTSKDLGLQPVEYYPEKRLRTVCR